MFELLTFSRDSPVVPVRQENFFGYSFQWMFVLRKKIQCTVYTRWYKVNEQSSLLRGNARRSKNEFGVEIWRFLSVIFRVICSKSRRAVNSRNWLIWSGIVDKKQTYFFLPEAKLFRYWMSELSRTVELLLVKFDTSRVISINKFPGTL